MPRSLPLLALSLVLFYSLPANAQDERVAPIDSTTPAHLDSTASLGSQALTARLDRIFARVPAFSELEASAAEGVVTLRGTLPSATARDDVWEIVSKLPNVLYIDDQVDLTEPPTSPPDEASDLPEVTSEDEQLEARLEGVFARVAPLSRVEVDVSGGVVQLGGIALDEESRQHAVELAESSDGVLYVHDGIEISRDLGERLTPSVERFTTMGREFVADLPLIGIAALVFVAFLALAWWVGSWSLSVGPLATHRLIRDVVRRILQTLVALAGVFAALEIVGATAMLGAVLGAAGVVGLAFGFAFRDIVENYLASILLSVRRPFAADDYIEVNGAHAGTVVSLTTSDTILMTADGNHLRLPNALVFKGTLVNFTRNPRRRFDFPVGIGTEDDLKQAQDLGLQTLADMPGVLDQPASFARVEDLAESSVTVRFFGWVDQREADFAKVKSQSIRLIKERFDRAGITMPAPTYRVEMPSSKLSGPPEDAAPPTDPEDLDVSPQDDVGDQVREERAREGSEDLLQGAGADSK